MLNREIKALLIPKFLNEVIIQEMQSVFVTNVR